MDSPADERSPLRLRCVTAHVLMQQHQFEGRVNQSMPLHQRHVTVFLLCSTATSLPLPPWSEEHERTATLPFCLRSFFPQRLWLCVIRRCDTFPVAHRYPLPSQEPWHAAHRPTCLRRAQKRDAVWGSPLQLCQTVWPLLTPAHQQSPEGCRRPEASRLICLFILTVCTKRPGSDHHRLCACSITAARGTITTFSTTRVC